MSFSQVRIQGNRATPDYVYYNATVINNEIATTQQSDDPIVSFQETRQTPLLVDTSQYTVSVENFTLNGASKTLPIFIPQTVTSINNTIYTVTFSIYNGTNFYSSTKNIQWEPENLTNFTVIPTAPNQDTDYYWCYTYSHWVRLVNKALKSAYDEAVASAGTVGTQLPFFEFDETTGLFSLNQDAKTSIAPVGVALPAPYSNTYTAAGSYQTGEYSFVGCNANLEGLLTNFESDYYAAGVKWRSSSINLPESVFNFGLTNLNNSASAVTGANAVGVSLKTKPTSSSFILKDPFTAQDYANQVYVRVTQDYISTGSLWSPIASFVLGTNQIPVRNEYVSAPVLLGSENIGTGNGVNAAFSKALIEVPINAVTADLWRGWIMYEPLTPTRSSMDAVHDGLTQLDFTLYWRNRLTNSLNPVRIYNSGTMSLRLLFERRGVGT